MNATRLVGVSGSPTPVAPTTSITSFDAGPAPNALTAWMRT